jgi:hypothetical protein
MEFKKISIPEGWKFYDVDGDNILLVPDKLDTWEKCLATFKFEQLAFIDGDSAIIRTDNNSDLFDEDWIDHEDRHNMPEEYAEAMLALCQLLICYKAWVKDWVPSAEVPYSIVVEGSIPGYRIIENKEHIQHLLTFPTQELCEDFFKTFKKLIDQAKPLL